MCFINRQAYNGCWTISRWCHTVVITRYCEKASQKLISFQCWKYPELPTNFLGFRSGQSCDVNKGCFDKMIKWIAQAWFNTSLSQLWRVPASWPWTRVPSNQVNAPRSLSFRSTHVAPSLAKMGSIWMGPSARLALRMVCGVMHVPSIV